METSTATVYRLVMFGQQGHWSEMERRYWSRCKSEGAFVRHATYIWIHVLGQSLTLAEKQFTTQSVLFDEAGREKQRVSLAAQ